MLSNQKTPATPGGHTEEAEAPAPARAEVPVVTFPTAPRPPGHPSLPVRPDRTRDVSAASPERLDRQGRPIRITIFSEREIRPGFVREISTTTDRVHVRRRNDRHSIRFALEDLPLLERAIELSQSPAGTPAQNAGKVRLAFGGVIEVGAAPGRVLLRIIFKGKRTDSARLEGAEIPALQKAIQHLRSTAASPHFEKGK